MSMGIFDPITKQAEENKIDVCDTCGLVDHHLVRGACEKCNESIKTLQDMSNGSGLYLKPVK